MATGELKSQVDKVWNAFWSGGIANPVEVTEQITYLLFIKRLDELHTMPMSNRRFWPATGFSAASASCPPAKRIRAR